MIYFFNKEECSNLNFLKKSFAIVFASVFSLCTGFSVSGAPDTDIPTYKVVLLGDTSVGKTSIVNRVKNKYFSMGEESTVGGNCTTQKFDTPSGEVGLDIWDTAGQERYRTLMPLYFREANAAVLVCDCNNSNSLANLAYWFTLLSECCCPLVIAVVGNKSDELSEELQNDFREKLMTWVNDNIPEKIELSCFITSAKTGYGILELTGYLAESLAAHNSAESLALEEKSRSKCSC
ncbi:MAG: GTP-binding protein [Oscillospiraceae bacterium]|nr:GTP-binding protein [Oscillospiraceae bacterium]